MRHDLDLSVLSSPWVFIPLLLVLFGESITVILAAINFRSIVVDISGVPVEHHTAIKFYNIANVYKFIPGGIMYVVGRNRMAVEVEGLSHGKVAFATLIEGMIWIVAAIILSSIFAFHYFIYFMRQIDILPLAGFLFGLAVLIAIPILYRFRTRLLAALHNGNHDTSGLLAIALVKRFAFSLVVITLLGFSFLATLVVLGQPITLNLGITIVGLYILSWLIGFLTPGAPSGLGIREFILLMFLGGILNEDILLSAIMIHRALQIAGDIVAYIIALGYAQIKSKPR